MNVIDHPRVGLVAGLVVGGIGIVAAPPVWAFVLWVVAGLIVLATAIPWWLRKLRIEVRRVPRDVVGEQVLASGGTLDVPLSSRHPSNHATELRATLAANLDAVRDFKAEYETIMGPQLGATGSDHPIAQLAEQVVRELPNLPLNSIRQVVGWLSYLHEHLGEEWAVDLEQIDPETVPKHRLRLLLRPSVGGFSVTGTEPDATLLKMSLEKLVRTMRNEALKAR
jgi:hypothetical protein